MLICKRITLDKKADKDTLEGEERYCKIYNVRPTKCSGQAERMQNHKMPKQLQRKRGRPRKIWTDEIEEHLNTTGIRNRQVLVTAPSVMEEHIFEAKVPNTLCHL
jgi:hypothetical protein